MAGCTSAGTVNRDLLRPIAPYCELEGAPPDDDFPDFPFIDESPPLLPCDLSCLPLDVPTPPAKGNDANRSAGASKGNAVTPNPGNSSSDMGGKSTSGTSGTAGATAAGGDASGKHHGKSHKKSGMKRKSNGSPDGTAKQANRPEAG